MAWSGSGTYSLPPAYSPEVNGTTIDAVRYNGLTSDVASGITACLAKNGENVPTANLPMGGFKHTGAADASATGQYIAFNQATAVGSLTIAALTVTSATGERFIVTGSTVPANGIYLSAANTLAFASNTTARATVNSTGNWTINAPSSGATLTVTGGTTALTVNGAASGIPFNVNFGSGAGGFSQYQLSSVTKGYIGVDGGGLIGSGTGNNFGIRADNELLLMGGARDAMRVGTTGAVTINAPISGTALTTNGVAGAITALFNGGNTAGTVLQINNNGTLLSYVGAGGGGALSSGAGTDLAFRAANASGNILFGAGGDNLRFEITSDGRVFGTAIHNNAGAVTGTTNQYIASGTYTPTLTNTTNVASSSFTNSPPAKWIRVGNVVQVSGHVTITPTAAAGTQTVLDLSLPIASNFANFEDCSGTASDGASGVGTANSSAVIQASVANDRAQIVYVANNTNSKIFGFNFSYTVL